MDTDYITSDVLQQNVMKYICGYLINKLLKIHSCDICVSYSKTNCELNNESLYCYFRAFQNGTLDTFGNLRMPKNEFVYFISSLEVSFQNNFENLIVGTNVITGFVSFNYNHPCENFPISHLLKLYGRVRLFYTLKYINKNFKSQKNIAKKRRKNKIIIWRHE